MFKKLKNLFSGASENERQLLEQFYVTLNTMYLKAKKGNINLEEYSDVTTRLEKLLQERKSWRNAYQLEQLLVQIFDDETLEIELGRRLVDIKNILSEDVNQYYSESADTPELPEKRALLDRVVNDLQWKYELRQLERSYRRLIRIRTSTVFVFSVLAFFIPLVLLKLGVELEAPLYITAITSGWFGAAFSMLINLGDRLEQSTLDDLRVQYRYDFLTSRVVIGMGAALILYFFLQAELLTGSILPDLNHNANLTGQNFALFVIWSFIAGFSEKFVPNLLIRAEEKVEVKS